MHNCVTQIVVVGLLFIPTQGQAQETGRIEGTIVVRAKGGNALVPGFELVFASDTLRQSVSTGPAGEYRADLPAGRYSVSSNQAGFYPIQRAPFEIKPKTTIMINVSLMVHPITIYNLGPKQLDYVVSPDDPLKTEHFRDKTAMIRFAKRSEANRSTEYRGAPFQSGKERLDVVPVLTYDALTISATRFVVEKGTLKVRAVGNVVIEDGRDRRQGGEAFIDLGVADPITTVKIQRH